MAEVPGEGMRDREAEFSITTGKENVGHAIEGHSFGRDREFDRAKSKKGAPE